MKIRYKNQCELIRPSTAEINGDLLPCPGGYYVVNDDGTILSVQPSGDVSNRPSGTTPGPFEICNLDSSINVLRFNPLARFTPGTPGIPYALAYYGQ